MDVSLSNLRQKYGVESLGSRMNVMHAIMGLKEHYGPTTFGRSGTSPGPAVAPANITEPPAFKAASEQARVDFPALKPTKSVVSPGRNSPLLEKTNSLPKLSPAVAKHSTPDTSRSSTPVQRFSSKASFTSLADRIESVESDSTATLSVPAEPTTSKIRSKVIHSNILQQTPVINVEVIPVPPAPSPPEPVPELDAIRQYALDAASWHSSLEQAATLVSTPVETKRPPPPTEPSPTTAPNLLQVEVPTKVEATLMDEVYAAIDGLGRGWLDDAYLGTSVDLSLPPLLEISRTSPKKTVRRVRSRSMVLPRTSPRESSDGGSVRRRDDASVSYRYSASETTIHSIDTASETPRPSFGGLAGAAPSMKSGRTRSISGSSMNSKSERASNLFARMIGMGGGQKISKPVVKLDYGLLGRADREGFLYVRSQQDPESHKWRKRWCVLIGTVLYMTNGPGVG